MDLARDLLGIRAAGVIDHAGPERACADGPRHQIRCIEAERISVQHDVTHPTRRVVDIGVGIHAAMGRQECALRHPKLVRDGRFQPIQEHPRAVAFVGHADDRARAQNRLAQILRLIGGEVEEIDIFAHHGAFGEEGGHETCLPVHVALRRELEQASGAVAEVSRGHGPLIADMSSDILSRPINVSDFGLIYAGAQKNMGPAGVTMVIIRDELVGKNHRDMPSMLNYETHVKQDSMFNTPPVLSVFAVNETLKWIKGLGGLVEMEKRNKEKAEKLYSEIDRNTLFTSLINMDDRSMMNIPFVFEDRAMDDDDFLSFCDERGLKTLKGHRSVGGFRASIYNAMPLEGVEALISTMQEYETLK